MPDFKLLKIVSGAQTGVDLAALDFAINKNIPYTGWCPKGRLNENGVIPSSYNLKEAPLEDPACRTTLNILDSDGTLICTFDNEMQEGTRLTYDLCIIFKKPVLIVNLKDQNLKNKLIVISFIEQHNILTLNVAGNRESQSPGIQERTLSMLEVIFI